MGPCGGSSDPAEVPVEPLGSSAGVAAEEEQGAETQRLPLSLSLVPPVTR